MIPIGCREVFEETGLQINKEKLHPLGLKYNSKLVMLLLLSNLQKVHGNQYFPLL